MNTILLKLFLQLQFFYNPLQLIIRLNLSLLLFFLQQIKHRFNSLWAGNRLIGFRVMYFHNVYNSLNMRC